MKYLLCLLLVLFLTNDSVGSESKETHLLYFSGEYCRPCRQLKKDIYNANDKQVQKFKKQFAKIEILEIPNKRQKEYNINAVPTTILLLKKGKKVLAIHKHIGYSNKQNYIKVLTSAHQKMYSAKRQKRL